MRAIRIAALSVALSLSCAGQIAEVIWPPTIVERGPHHRVWQSTIRSVDEGGRETVRTGGYVELATGLHYWKEGQWQESREEFKVLPAAFVAVEGPHRVILARNLNGPASVDLLLPDGQRLQSNPMGLSFFDTASGQNVLLGEVKDCAGELVGPNVVVYADAFDGGIKGAIKYQYSKSGFSQDIILYDRKGLGAPEDYGLRSESTLLEMYTEFHRPPAPVKSSQRLGENLPDETLTFGALAIERGVAWVLNGNLAAVPVGKTWARLSGRDFLVESVPYRAIEPLLEEAGLLVVGSRLRQPRLHERGHRVEVLHQRLQMRPRIVYRPEVGHEDCRRRPGLDPRHAVAPRLDVDVGRWRRRQNVAAVDADPSGITDERDSARSIEVAHVVGCVAGRIRDVERPAARVHPLASGQRLDVALRYGGELSPEAVHVIAVEASRALEQPLRIDHVPGAALVDVHLHRRMPRDDRAGRTGVIEVDVREQ